MVIARDYVTMLRPSCDHSGCRVVSVATRIHKGGGEGVMNPDGRQPKKYYYYYYYFRLLLSISGFRLHDQHIIIILIIAKTSKAVSYTHLTLPTNREV